MVNGAHAIWHQTSWSILDQITARRLLGTKPSPEPMLTFCQLHPKEHTLMNYICEIQKVLLKKCICLKFYGGLRIHISVFCNFFPFSLMIITLKSWLTELLKFQVYIKYKSFNVWAKYSGWNFKGCHWNSTYVSCPYTERVAFKQSWILVPQDFIANKYF